LNKPIFGMRWYNSKKPPSLQIEILKLIMLQGELSKTKAKKILDSNYSDVSDAMDALASNERQFIKLSRKTGRRRREKFYKITENGLRALFAPDMSPDDFWRLMILLLLCSKQLISYEELDDHYRQFERNYFGHSAVYGYFFLSYFFDLIRDSLLQKLSKSKVCVLQMIIECLALNRSLTLPELIKKTCLKEDEVITILDNHSIHTNLNLPAWSRSPYTSIDDLRKEYYVNFISHSLIIIIRSDNGNTYELSLFGVMIMIFLIRYHYLATQNNTTKILSGFHNVLQPNEYCDRIAKNYKEKLPLIFEKWDFLKSKLGGFLLYESFDFLIYEKARFKSAAYSVWIEGNKEFYDDVQALASNGRDSLFILYASGRLVLENFQRYWNVMNNPRIYPIDRKLREIADIVQSADFPRTKEISENRLSFIDETESQNLRRIKTIERIFAEELAFLYYLNLNTTGFSSDLTKEQNIQYLLPPKNRLMAILSQDNDIKQWFTERIGDIMHYREQTLNKMSEFYNEILDSTKYSKNEQNKQSRKASGRAMIAPTEFDIDKICSY
jgi:hypothetical protein